MEHLNISFFILSFSSLFTLINPIGITPILLGLTENTDDKEYTRIVKRGIIIAYIILFIFSLMGSLIFDFYGITINAFMIAGGILFFKSSMDMIEAKVPRSSSTPKETKEAEKKDDISITPIGMPLIAGPGAITSVMLLSSQALNITEKLILHFNIFITLTFTFIILILGKKISKKIGTTGIRIIQRIMGLILLVISIQFIINGITPLLIN
jgi:multiple antibiotic resistance protein